MASLSLMGIPLFGGFISKWNLAWAAFDCAEGYGFGPGSWLPVAGVAVILYSALMTGVYMLTVLVRAYFPAAAGGESAAADEGRTETWDPGWRMLVPILIFGAMILLLGLRPVWLMSLLTKIGGEAG